MQDTFWFLKVSHTYEGTGTPMTVLYKDVRDFLGHLRYDLTDTAGVLENKVLGMLSHTLKPDSAVECKDVGRYSTCL